MSDVYALAIDGVFPRLRSFRIYVGNAVIKTVSSRLPAIASLRMPNLETFDLYLKQRGLVGEGEEQVDWTTVETLTSHSVMPSLQRCSLLYTLLTSIEIQQIFESPLFDNDARHVHVRFGLYLDASTFMCSSDITKICAILPKCYNNICVQYVSIFLF
jgi:hypothetical protein